MKASGFNLEVKFNLQKEFVKGDDHDILMSGSIHQFPYGIGGMDEVRKWSDGKQSNKLNLYEYYKYLSLMSCKEFQELLFQLVIYSMFLKLKSWIICDYS